MSQGGSGVVGRDLGLFVRDDIKLSSRTRVHFLDFLKVMVKKCAVDPNVDKTSLLKDLVDVTTKVYNSDAFSVGREKLRLYCAERNGEKTGYPFLRDCMNNAFEALRNEEIKEFRELSEYSNIVAYVNDPRFIKHKYISGVKPSSFSPDLCLVSKDLVDSKNAGILDESKKNKFPVLWSQVFATVEAKHVGQNGFSKVQDKYTAKPATEVKEYRVLQDRMFDKNTTLCASALYSFDPSLGKEAALTHPNDRVDTELDARSVTSESTNASVESYRAKAQIAELAAQSSEQSIIDRFLKRKASDQPESSGRASKKSNTSGTAARYELMPTEQNSLYGLEMLCRGIYSLHSINIIIVDDLVYVWWYDRQNVIQTSGLNFVEDMPYFMALLTVFQRFTLADWGVEPSLAPPDMFMEKNEDPKLSVEFTLDPKVVVTLKHPGSSELPFRGPVLKGRATCILSATGKSEFVIKQSLVIKAYWPETRRSNEATIIQKAIDALEESNKKDLVKHLPKLIAWKDIDSSNTLNIMSELGKSYDPKTDPARILRLLLFRRLEPLESITKEDEFTKAWLQCFTCHYHLWVKGIQHGDISVWNLMRDPVESCGVLNDFDLSVIKGGSSENRGGERTGTLPFMARKLLNIGFLSGNEERKYIYELESFVWVFAWLCLRGESDIPDPGMDWRQRDLRNAAGAKQLFLLEYAQVTPESCYRYAWGKCGKLIQLLRDIDENQALRDRLRLTGEINSHSVYSEVFKIIETEYTIADWLNFKSRIMSDALQEAENL